MVGVAEMAERGGEVGRADEDAVDAVDRRDRRRGLEAGAALDLHHDADLVVDAGEVVGDGAVAVAALRDRDAAHAGRRIAGRGDRAARLVGGLHERHQEVVEAGVEQALDLDRVVPRRPDDRRAGAVLQRHQLRNEGRDVVGRVLAVEQQPVEAGDAEDLGGDRVGERAPAADQRLAARAGAA